MREFFITLSSLGIAIYSWREGGFPKKFRGHAFRGQDLPEYLPLDLHVQDNNLCKMIARVHACVIHT